VGSVPQNSGAHVTRIGALGIRGLEALMTVEGATEGEVFRAYGKGVLSRTLKRGDIVVRALSTYLLGCKTRARERGAHLFTPSGSQG
jgi:hypothetical protein